MALRSGAAYTGLDLTTQEGKKLFLKARNNSDYAARSVIGEKICLANVVVHQRMLVDDDSGEEQSLTVASLIADDGTVISTTSRTVLAYLSDLISLFGRPPWVPPMMVKIGQKQISADKSVVTLEMI